MSGLVDEEPLVCYDRLGGSLGADTGLVCAGRRQEVSVKLSLPP